MKLRTFAALSVIAASCLTQSQVAEASCYPAGSIWDRYHNPSGATHSCRFTMFHGNYGTVGFSQNSATEIGTNSAPCTSVSMQVVATNGSGLVNGPKLTDSTWANGAEHTSTVGSGYSVFGSNWWANRAGVYSVLYQDVAVGC